MLDFVGAEWLFLWIRDVCKFVSINSGCFISVYCNVSFGSLSFVVMEKFLVCIVGLVLVGVLSVVSWSLVYVWSCVCCVSVCVCVCLWLLCIAFLSSRPVIP